MNDARDDDSALRRVLREADPASGLPPLTARDAGLIRERIMLASRAAAPAPRRRGWLIGGLSAATAAAAGAIAVPLMIGTGAGGVTALQSPPAGGPAAICAEVSSEALETAADLAFRADVESIDGLTVVLRVTSRFAGDVSDTVTVPQGAGVGVDGAPPAFTEGGSYLVAARDGFVLGCGLTGEDEPALATVYEQAF